MRQGVRGVGWERSWQGKGGAVEWKKSGGRMAGDEKVKGRIGKEEARRGCEGKITTGFGGGVGVPLGPLLGTPDTCVRVGRREARTEQNEEEGREGG